MKETDGEREKWGEKIGRQINRKRLTNRKMVG